MKNTAVIALVSLLVAVSCGGTRQGESSEPVSSAGAESKPAESKPAEAPRRKSQRRPEEMCQPIDFEKLRTTGQAGPYAMKVQTIGDYAEQRGVHVGFVVMANQACVRYDRCTGQKWHFCDDCMIDVWCNEINCELYEELDSEGPEWTECIQAVQQSSCEQASEPIRCGLLDQQTAKIRINDVKGWLPKYELR